ncbi:NLPA lipoprotein [Polaribacter sp. KT25b]|uniref:MetQ/NlpA family ABC transporter substrate-binding protein n=1 Tax=Polaribacter sp. KT25b TaxID=1855336 RepID=UPI00087ADFAF|nr:MetQ/NlpA family ABC transporter substrate-binding protein [Polaribacter sp. KT25b]SDS40118.1 NLPA lipoprotein [Polaribacter sp. KT25b]
MKNWKVILSIIFSTLILYNSLRVSITYLYYNLDTKGFIEAYCENKDKPELQCNGKCHLKKVTKTTDEEKNQPIQLIDFKDILLYNQNISSHEIDTNIFQTKSNFFYLNLYNFRLLDSYFHPPNV